MKGNTISIHGNVTRDAEIKTTQSGRMVYSWGVAWNSSRKNPQTGQYEDVAHFFDVKMWVSDGQARCVPPIAKGALCVITDGHLVQERWQDQDGSSRSRAVVMVDDPIQGLAIVPKGQSRQDPSPYPSGAQPGAYAAPQQGYEPTSIGQHQAAVYDTIYDEDIPF